MLVGVRRAEADIAYAVWLYSYATAFVMRKNTLRTDTAPHFWFKNEIYKEPP